MTSRRHPLLYQLKTRLRLAELAAASGADHASQCLLELPWRDLASTTWILRDQLSPATYDRDGGDRARRGFYRDLPAWAYCLFEVTPSPAVGADCT